MERALRDSDAIQCWNVDHECRVFCLEPRQQFLHCMFVWPQRSDGSQPLQCSIPPLMACCGQYRKGQGYVFRVYSRNHAANFIQSKLGMLVLCECHLHTVVHLPIHVHVRLLRVLDMNSSATSPSLYVDAVRDRARVCRIRELPTCSTGNLGDVHTRENLFI